MEHPHPVPQPQPQDRREPLRNQPGTPAQDQAPSRRRQGGQNDSASQNRNEQDRAEQNS